jgi:leader peptidase (prepilin peptidase)/N-methyltransferase
MSAHILSTASLISAESLDALPLIPVMGFAIVLGLVVGSFLNVVVHRLPIMLERDWRANTTDAASATGQHHASDGLPARYNLWLPRSACPHCGHLLSLWENIPLLSWLALRGHCSHCHARVSARYPLIELAGAVCAVLALAWFGPSGKALAAFVLCAALIAASAIDFEHQMLYDEITQPLLWGGLIVNLSGTFVSLHEAVIGAIAGYFALWCVYWIFWLLRRIEGMGQGDCKLLAALGAWLGWNALPQIVMIAAVTGAAVGLTATLTKRMRFAEPMPFGPYLAAGALITLFVGTSSYFAWGG